ncbi:MAG TPA: hypothetical protein VGL26_00170 [Jatrophihabitans sp.]
MGFACPVKAKCGRNWYGLCAQQFGGQRHGERGDDACAGSIFDSNGTQITSGAPGGALVISDGERVKLDGTATISKPATLHLAQLPDESIGYLSDTSGWSAAGHSGTLTLDKKLVSSGTPKKTAWSVSTKAGSVNATLVKTKK